MKKTTKVWLTIAGFLTVLGLIVFGSVMAAYDWDFTKLSTVAYETRTYEIMDGFDRISIHVDTTQIEFVPADDGNCRVVCFEEEKVSHSVAVENRTLVIDTVDTRKWYDHIGISISSPKLTVYLPKRVYAALFVETDTGDIEIPADFIFSNLKIHGDTSDVHCLASVLGRLEIQLSTGDIEMDNITAGQVDLATTTGDITIGSVTTKNKVAVETETGSIQLTDVSCLDLLAETDTGTISLKNVLAMGKFSIESDTGNVRFEGSDAGEVFVETDTGDVTGTLLSDKIFITKTSTGRIVVPGTTTGGRCEITTSTGDIKIEIN